MTANTTDRKQKFNVNYRKENGGFIREIIGLNNEGGPVVHARIYHPGKQGDAPTYCALWIHDRKGSSGTGKANGYGYHKASAALAEAITNAGYDLSEDIDGRGDSAMAEAVKALTIAAVGHCLNVIEAHA